MNVFTLVALSLLFVLPASAQGWRADDGSTSIVPDEGVSFSALGEGYEELLLAALLDEAAEEDGPAVAVAVMHHGDVVASSARGVADREHRVVCTPETTFDMGSVSKSVTAAAIAVLVENGRLDLDASVRVHLPELATAFDGVRVRHLVHHTAGVEDTTGMLALAGLRASDVVDHADALRILFVQRSPRFTPGSRFMYSNGGYVLLAEIVARVTGEPFGEWARRELFAPVAMESAQLLDGSGAVIDGRAAPTDLVDEEWYRRAVSTRYGAGGLVCSVLDLVRWGEELRTGERLGQGVAARIKTVGALADGTPLDYAFGLSRGTVAGREAWMHSGSVSGGQSYLVIVPSEELVLAIATNSASGMTPSTFAREALEVLLGPSATSADEVSRPRMIMIPETQAVPSRSEGVVVEAEEIARYAGSYVMVDELNGSRFTLSVATEGTRLRIGFDDAPNLDVFPLPSGRFLVAPANYELEFEPARGRATMHITPESIRNSEPRAIIGQRVDTSVLRPEDAAAVAGFYRHVGLGTLYEIAVADGTLVLRHPRHGDLPMTRLAGETFTLPGRDLARVDLLRDEERVIGIQLTAYSWGSTARFDRLELR